MLNNNNEFHKLLSVAAGEKSSLSASACQQQLVPHSIKSLLQGLRPLSGSTAGGRQAESIFLTLFQCAQKYYKKVTRCLLLKL